MRNAILLVEMLFLGSFMACIQYTSTISTPPSVATIDFDGRVWRSIGFPENIGDAPRLMYLRHEAFVNVSENERLLVGTEPKPDSDSVYSKIVCIQTKVDQAWKRNGRSQSWLKNGETETCFYSNGIENGEFRAFHADGSKKIERTYKNGKTHGVETKWNRDGSVEYSVKYENGVQVDPPLGK